MKQIVKHWEDVSGYVKQALFIICAMQCIGIGFFAAIFNGLVMFGIVPMAYVIYCVTKIPNNKIN